MMRTPARFGALFSHDIPASFGIGFRFAQLFRMNLKKSAVYLQRTKA
jgi:hypothetical protein